MATFLRCTRKRDRTESGSENRDPKLEKDVASGVTAYRYMKNATDKTPLKTLRAFA